MFNKYLRRWPIVGLTLAVLAGSVIGFAAVPKSATAAPNSLGVGPASTVVQPGGTVTLSIVAEAPAALLGAWDLRVSFDNSVVQLTDPGAPCAGQSNCNLISSGSLGLNGFNANGLSGIQSLASVQFTAVGTAGQSSNIGIQIIDFTDPNSTPTNPTITNGLITIQATTAPTPAPTRSPTPTIAVLVIVTQPPTPTASPVPTASASPPPTALPAAATPVPTASPAPAVIVASTDKNRPSVVRSVPTLGDLNLSAANASTNLFLAILTMIVLFLTAAIFNQTVKENERRIHATIAGVSAPFAAFLGAANRMTGGSGGDYGVLRALIPPFVGLGIIAALYGLEEPGAGLNDRSLVLFLSYFGAFAITTIAFEGVQWLMSRRYGATAVVRVFPIGIFVAVAAVLITKVTGFQPGLMYGFVAAHAIVSETRLTAEQQGRQTLYPAIALLGACLLAWVLAGPLRSYAEDHSQWYNAVPEGIAVGLFVSGLEGLFFQLIPIDFMEGRKLFIWNKLAWLAISLASGFLFWQVLINNDKDSVDALGATSTIVALLLVVACLGATIALWMFFKALGPEEQAPPAGAEA